MMASPSSPILHSLGRAKAYNADNLRARLRRNSLVSDHEDIMLLREKLTRIAVGRRYEEEAIVEEDERQRRRSSNVSGMKHDKAVSFLPPERPNTPPSSPQPRDVLRKQLKLKQQTAKSRVSIEKEDQGLEAAMSVDEVAIMPMDDVEEDNAVYSPRSMRGHRRSPQARFSIPEHLRSLSSFSILNKRPEGWRKRKCVHVAAAEDEEEEPRVSLKKTSSQVNILTASKSTLSRSSSAGGLFQKYAAAKRLEQDQEMEDVGCSTQPQSPENALFGSKHGQLSACS